MLAVGVDHNTSGVHEGKLTAPTAELAGTLTISPDPESAPVSGDKYQVLVLQNCKTDCTFSRINGELIGGGLAYCRPTRPPGSP